MPIVSHDITRRKIRDFSAGRKNREKKKNTTYIQHVNRALLGVVFRNRNRFIRCFLYAN